MRNKKKNEQRKGFLIKRTNEAEVIYLELVKELEGVIDIGKDRVTLTLLAQAINMVNACDEILNKTTDLKSCTIEIALRREAARTIIQLANRFGLSPKDRKLLEGDGNNNFINDEAGDDL